MRIRDSGLLARVMALLRRSRPAEPAPGPRALRRVRLSAERHMRGLQAGDRSSPFAGVGLEADSVRPYNEGDPVRRVDWRVTARRDALHVRTYREDRDLPVILLLDRTDPKGRAHGGWVERSLRESFHWLASAASLAGHPLGVGTFGGGTETWIPPTRSRRSLQRILAVPAATLGATGRGSDEASHLEEALDSVLRTLPSEALVFVLSPFAMSSEAAEGFAAVIARAARRHRVVGVWPDPVRPLPHAGLLEVEMPGGGRVVVDAASPRVRERFDEVSAEWRSLVRRGFAAGGTAPIRIEPGDRTEVVLAKAFTPRRTTGVATGRGRARRRVGRAGVVGALVAGLFLVGPLVPPTGGGLWAQAVLPGEVRVELDTLLAPPVLGAPVVRSLRIRTVEGAELSGGDRGSGEVWDVRTVHLTAPDPGEAVWVVDVELVPWWMGRQRLPELGVQLTDPAGTRRIALPDRRVEIAEPGMPPTGPEPTAPEVPAASAWRWTTWLPPLLLLLAWALPAVRLATSLVGGMRRAAERKPPRVVGLAPREALDRVMASLREELRRREAVDPEGWTLARWREWGAETGDAELAAAVVALVELADEPRFRPGGPGEEEVRAADASLRRIIVGAP